MAHSKKAICRERQKTFEGLSTLLTFYNEISNRRTLDFADQKLLMIQYLNNLFGEVKIENDSVYIKNLRFDKNSSSSSFSKITVLKKDITIVKLFVKTLKQEIQSKNFSQINIRYKHESQDQAYIFKESSETESLFDDSVVKIYEYETLGKLSKRIDLYENEEERYKFFSLDFSSWTSLHKIIKSIFYNYHLFFESFEKIKLCEQCSNMFLSYKNYKKFCSTKCRNKSVYKENIHIRKCYQRQRQFIANAYFKLPSSVSLSSPNYIIMDNCKECSQNAESVKGGSCLKLINKNKIIFENIRKEKLKKLG